MTYTFSDLQKNPNKIIYALMNLKNGVVIKKERKPYSVILRFVDFKKLINKLENLEDSLRAEKVYQETSKEPIITLEEYEKKYNLK